MMKKASFYACIFIVATSALLGAAGCQKEADQGTADAAPPTRADAKAPPPPPAGNVPAPAGGNAAAPQLGNAGGAQTVK